MCTPISLVQDHLFFLSHFFALAYELLCFVSQLNRSVIPVHSVYAPAVERVIHRLWHPDPEKEEAHDSKEDAKPEPAAPRKPRPACSTWLWL